MKLAEWLEHRAGLKGKKLEGAVKMCEDNWLETVGDLREIIFSRISSSHAPSSYPKGAQGRLGRGW